MADGQVDPTQADPTINKILRKVNNMTTDNDSEFTGVHIRNLFTYRTPYPRDLVEAFEDQMARLQEAEGLDEDELDWEISRNLAYSDFGNSFLDEGGVVPTEWEEQADNCELVLLA